MMMHQEGLQDKSFEIQRSKLKRDEERLSVKNFDKKSIRLEEINLPQKVNNSFIKPSLISRER